MALQYTRQQLETIISQLFIDNITEEITPEDMRIFATAIVTSCYNIKEDQLSVQDATELIKGIVQLATQVEVEAGEDASKVVTALRLAKRLEAVLKPINDELIAINEILNLPPAPPEGAEWVNEPTVRIEGNLVKVGAGLAKWNGVEKPYAAQNFPYDALVDNTKIRLDLIYATEQGTYGLLKGDEGAATTRKALPDGTLWVRDVIVKGDGATTDAPGTINFNYASYTGKATPEDAAVFLVQESSGTKYKWSLSQLITWLGTKNIGSSDFYFGPWESKNYETGWIAVSTDGKKFWRALQDFNSSAEPTQNNAYWKLVFESAAISGSAIPKTRTTQSGTTINFSQSTTQVRTLSADLTITGITNPVQGETIRLVITSGGYNLLLPSNVKVIGGTSFTVGTSAVNYIMLDCVDAANGQYIATITV